MVSLREATEPSLANRAETYTDVLIKRQECGARDLRMKGRVGGGRTPLKVVGNTNEHKRPLGLCTTSARSIDGAFDKVLWAGPPEGTGGSCGGWQLPRAMRDRQREGPGICALDKRSEKRDRRVST